jgi:hypothetical protein
LVEQRTENPRVGGSIPSLAIALIPDGRGVRGCMALGVLRRQLICQSLSG